MHSQQKNVCLWSFLKSLETNSGTYECAANLNVKYSVGSHHVHAGGRDHTQKMTLREVNHVNSRMKNMY